MTYRFKTIEKGRDIKYYICNACGQCAIKAQCTRNKDGRRITRWVDEEVLEEMEQRLRANPEKAKRRKELAEHPFGMIKHWMDQGHFLMRGFPNMKAEASLTILACSLKRAVNILGVKRRIEALA